MPWGQVVAGVSDADGFLLVDKDPGVTSHDCVSALRRLLGTRKIGHAGTLDPMATGLLVIGVGRATKLMQYTLGQPKRYTATVCLGASSMSDDADGTLRFSGLGGALKNELSGPAASDVTELGLSKLLTQQVDAWIAEHSARDILQRPSSVSAIKRDGVRAYERVRAGEEVELEARPVHIYSMKRVGPLRLVRAGEIHGTWEGEELSGEAQAVTQVGAGELCALFELDVTVSAGTYIRALARDLGADLGCGGHLQSLRRESIGPWQAGMRIGDLNNRLAGGGQLPLIGINELCGELFAPLTLTAGQCQAISYGKFLDMSVLAQGAHAEHIQNVTIENTGEATSARDVSRPWAAYYHGRVVALLETHAVAGGRKQVLKPALFFVAPEALRELAGNADPSTAEAFVERPQWRLRENGHSGEKKQQ